MPGPAPTATSSSYPLQPVAAGAVSAGAVSSDATVRSPFVTPWQAFLVLVGLTALSLAFGRRLPRVIRMGRKSS